MTMPPRSVPALALALALAACGGGGTTSSSGVHHPANRDPLCVFVDGDLASWRGLDARTIDALPECLGERRDRTSMRYHSIDVDVDYYQPAIGVEVWVYGAVSGGHVELIELKREAPVRATRVIDKLGAPDTTYRWAAADRAAAGPAAAFVTRDPDLAVDEIVYGGRGLALSVAHRGEQPAVLFRARGFAPTNPDDYLDALVRLPAP